MEEYKLPSLINPDKAFFVNRSELEGRIDSQFYSFKRTTFSKFKFPTERLKNFFEIRDGDHDKLPEEVITSKEQGKRYLRAQDLKEFQIIEEKPIYVNKEYFNKIKRCQIFPGDLLVSIMASIGLNVIVPSNFDVCVANRAIGILRLKKDIRDILPSYVQVLINTNIGFSLFEIEKKGGIQQRLNLSDIGTVKIPLPPLYIQEQIVDLFQSALNIKQQKEAEAKSLLDDVDNYLLSELGIIVPEKDNSLQKRVFTTRFSKIVGRRLDPKEYDSDTVSLRKAIIDVSKKKYTIKSLKEFINQSVSGDWGIEDSSDYDREQYIRCLVIRATEYDNDYNLNLDNSRIKFRLIKKEKLKNIDIQENDLLIEKSGGSSEQPVGRIAILTKDILGTQNICFSNFLHKIRVNNEISPSYLFCYLKTMHNIKLTESMQSQTNGIRNLIMTAYLNQSIILPLKDGKIDIDKQNQIANNIEDMREKAKQLQNEAKIILEQTKKEVELMILG